MLVIAEIAIIVGIVFFDQITKVLAASVLPSMGGSYNVFPGFAAFTYTENTGAAFSLFSDGTFVLGIVSAVVAVALFIVMVKTNKYKSVLLWLSLTFLIGGAIGNVIDRFMLGYVRDMIQFTFVDFAIFNVADSFACIGAVLIVIFLIFFMDKTKKRYNGEMLNNDDIGK